MFTPEIQSVLYSSVGRRGRGERDRDRDKKHRHRERQRGGRVEYLFQKENESTETDSEDTAMMELAAQVLKMVTTDYSSTEDTWVNGRFVLKKN